MRDGLGAVGSVVVLGGSSELGLAIAAELCRDRHATVVLAGRRPDALGAASARLVGAGAGRVETVAFDALDTASHDRVLAEAAAAVGGDVDVVVVAFGLLGASGGPGEDATLVAATNYVGAVSAGLAAARLLRRQGHGAIVALSSVAGERVRKANFVYGSSKAGMDGFFQGLGDWLAGTGVEVLVVRPGFVRTKMTAGMKPAPLATTAERVAAETVRALRAGRGVVWVPPVLRLLFIIFRHLPRPLWRRVPG
ncbi:MAG TPA: decaprenylphospho-beta-D-erythro-pentofuranosid-2-ulose 2-reductase [Acidimicrobiales bacterium]|nr:decaprenylphospho-beta-D-erythro-pentofuranosid-2-ulose 2-reductase [Acidimicrobiales bacterium]